MGDTDSANADAHIEIDLTSEQTVRQSERQQPSPPLEVVVDTTSSNSGCSYIVRMNKRRSRYKRKLATRDIDETNQPEALIESIVISSSDEDVPARPGAKKIKLRKDSSQKIGESSQGPSRSREPKDHPSRIKSSKKIAKSSLS